LRIGYGRVSSDSIEQQGSAESQRHMLTAAGCDQVFIDVDISGYQLDKRQGSHWDHVLHLIASGQASELVIANWERLGREMSLFVQLKAAVRVHGIPIRELDSGRLIDLTNDPRESMVGQIRMALQEFDSAEKAVKVKRGLKAKRERGHLTHPKVPWAFRINTERTAIQPDPAVWDTARTLIDNLLDAERAWSLNDALRWLAGLCAPPPFRSRSGLANWLRSPVLRGAVVYGTNDRNGTVRQYDDVLEGQHAALVTIHEQQRLEARLDANRRLWGAQAKRTPKPWSGITFCAACGKTLRFKRIGSPPRTYYACTNLECLHRHRHIPLAVVRHAIERSINSQAGAIAELLTAPPPATSESPEALKLAARIARWEADIRDDASLADDLAPLVSKARRQLQQLKAGQQQDPALLAFAAAFLHSPWVWAAMPTATYAEVLQRTVERLDVDLSGAAITHRRPVAVRMKVGPVDGTLPPADCYPTWNSTRRMWETKLDINDLPPTPVGKRELMEQIRDGWTAVMGGR
jgi:DNA invertase Pin-like site-specific DNA recombinase